MTLPTIEQTETDTEEFTDELSDEALDRVERPQFTKCPLSSMSRHSR